MEVTICTKISGRRPISSSGGRPGFVGFWKKQIKKQNKQCRKILSQGRERFGEGLEVRCVQTSAQYSN